jgi:hypothetical protein
MGSQRTLDQWSQILSTVNELILILVGWLALGTAILVLLQIYRRSRRRNVSITEFINASGLPELDGNLQSLKYLVRERVVERLRLVQRQLREKPKDSALPAAVSPDSFPAPTATSDQELNRLAESLTAYVPQFAPIVQLLRDIAFRQKGIRVSGKLQRRTGAPNCLGVTLEISGFAIDSVNAETVWEAEAPASGQDCRLRERLLTILEPASCLLASRLVHYELLGSYQSDKLSIRAQLRLATNRLFRKNSRASIPPQHTALVSNFVGMLLTFDAYRIEHEGYSQVFFRRAATEFDRAVKAAPSLYQPWENRGHLYLQWAQMDSHRAPELLAKALSDLNSALQRITQLPTEARQTVERRLRLGRSYGELRTADPELVNHASEQIAELESFATLEMDDFFLFNLACWHGLYSLQQRNSRALSKAVTYLAYSLIRDPNSERWAAADQDSDLIAIRELVSDLRNQLMMALGVDPTLPSQTGAEFSSKVARWLSPVLARLDRQEDNDVHPECDTKGPGTNIIEGKANSI